MDEASMFQVITTSDGSASIYSEQYGSTYHSKHGAMQESMHVFIEQGLLVAAAQKQSLHLLEIGFGTGLNAWLTLQAASANNLSISYTALELHPLPATVTDRLNYPDSTALVKPDLFYKMHELAWQKRHEIAPNFSLLKIETALETWEPTGQYDLIYFDAFGPETQPALWDEAMMQKMATLLVPGGILVTFCAKGSFKRALKAAGLEVQRLPGPPGKREMTRAVKYI